MGGLAAEDPADEAAGLALMRARFAAGNRGGALMRSTGSAPRSGSSGSSRASRRSHFTRGSRVALRYDRALAAVELELKSAPVAERADLLATRADLLMATADRGAPAAYAEAAAAAGPDGMALRIRQAWAQLAGGDANAARATLAQLAPGSERERVAHLLAQAAAAWFSGDPDQAGSSAAEAQTLAVASGLAREARMAVQIQAMVAHSTGNWSDAVLESLDASLLAPDLADSLFDGHLCIGEYALTCGEPLNRVRDTAEELHARAVRSGARRAQVFLATLLGGVALVRGLIDEADARLREAAGLSREIGAVSAEAFAILRLGEAAIARGEVAEGYALLADGLVISRWSPISGHLLPLGYARCCAQPMTPASASSASRTPGRTCASSRSYAPTAAWRFGWRRPARRRAVISSIRRRCSWARRKRPRACGVAAAPGWPRSTKPVERSRGQVGIAPRRARGCTRPARRSRATAAGSTPVASTLDSPGSRDPGRFGEGRPHTVLGNHHLRRTLDEHLRNPSPQRLARPGGSRSRRDALAAGRRRADARRRPLDPKLRARRGETGRWERFASIRRPMRMPFAVTPQPPTSPRMRLSPWSTRSSSAPTPSLRPRSADRSPSHEAEVLTMSTTDQPNPNKALWEKGDFTQIAATMRESGEALVASMGITAGVDVLDLGCGDGTTALPAARLGANVLGVDIAENLVAAGNARVQRLGLTNCRFQQGDASDLVEIDDDSFDLVVSIFGAMFAPRPDDVASEMVRVTARGAGSSWVTGSPATRPSSPRSCASAPPTRRRRRPGS